MLVVDIVIVIDTIVIVSIDTNDIIYIYTIVIDNVIVNVIVTYRPRFSNFRLEEEICQNPGKKIEVARTKMASYNRETKVLMKSDGVMRNRL